MNPNARVVVSLILPHSGKELRASVQIEECVYRESFAPLPRTRELSFEVDAQERAQQQKRMRERIAEKLSHQLAETILKLAEREDPHHGYSPQEWELIDRVCGS